MFLCILSCIVIFFEGFLFLAKFCCTVTFSAGGLFVAIRFPAVYVALFWHGFTHMAGHDWLVRYDGMRAQVHLLEDGSLRFFSRNSKDSSGELPDVIPVMKVLIILKSCNITTILIGVQCCPIKGTTPFHDKKY